MLNLVWVCVLGTVYTAKCLGTNVLVGRS